CAKGSYNILTGYYTFNDAFDFW
nr:immunoglobulin heavy chain junction region [Macaca mulatta]MOV40893.1 immunoglobulin heavy chain junction region [Macaca mulatta]MOV42759.1 immunoglobulin heavy chain junction region [Macaca mulatta]MOV43893.1 immunoglobulin heavy chain junction region [Macaca mulatta]MOV45027.1 immunoglobulin heavy chain junction region [Macaca mulatta]